MQKKISEKQLTRLLTKGSTVNLKGFKTENGSTEGLIRFDDDYKLVLEEKTKPVKRGTLTCPKCKKGNVIKGNTAYGCSNYTTGCDFKYLFSSIKEQAENKPLTKELVYQILNGNN